MAKEIDKIIQSKTAPKSNNVLWDDGENLKINRNGKWESTGGGAPMINITYANLVELRNNGELIAGMQYRITDYVTTTAQANTKSAGHQFDVVVLALSNNVLAEKAYAALHDGDTYFSEHGAKLEAWQIWYCLDNDATRFPWASVVKVEETITSAGEIKLDFPITGVYFGGTFYELPIGEEVYISYGPPVTVTLSQGNVLKVSDVGGFISGNPIVAAGFKEGEGKGVIYRMIDEHNNDLPYDFKNIIYIKNLSFQYFQWGQTYEMSRNASQDMTIEGEQFYCYEADIQPSGWSGRTCWIKDEEPTTSTIMYKADGAEISFGGNITKVDATSSEYYTFCDLDGKDFSFNKDCFGNVIKTWKNGLNRIMFKNLQGTCSSNTFGDDCFSNTFGNNCYSNTFGDDCYRNSFGNNCFSNTFGDYCSDNTFGNTCSSNTFGDDCFRNSFALDAETAGDYFLNNTFEDGVNGVKLLNDATASDSNTVRYYKVTKGTTDIEVDVDRNNSVEKYIGVNSAGEVKVFCLADLANL